MKITKQRLKEIIKEELDYVGAEAEKENSGQIDIVPSEVSPDAPEEEEVTKANLVALLRTRAQDWAADPKVQIGEVRTWMNYSDRLMSLAKGANISNPHYTRPLERLFVQLEKTASGQKPQ